MGNFGKRQFGKKRQNLAHQKLSLQIKLKFVLSPELYVNNTSTTALLGKFIDCDKHHTCPNTFTLALFNKRKLFFPQIMMLVIFTENQTELTIDSRNILRCYSNNNKKNNVQTNMRFQVISSR